MASISKTIGREMNKRKTAVAYGRYSSNNQREESIDAQLRAIREYCEKENIELIAEFTDEAMTGKNDDREDFQNMINKLLKGHIQADYVLVHKFNRFARNKFDSTLHKKKLRDIGIKVVSVTQKIDDTPEGELLEGFLETIDQYYSANLAAEVRKGLRENALKGKHAGGQVLFGYSLDDEGYYIPNENAKIVKRIFEEYVAGYPKTEICERLNREGYRNQRGRPFNTRTLYDLLRNEKYIGNYIYTIEQKETIRLDGVIKNHPIDKRLWNRVQELCEKSSTKNQPRQRTEKRFYHLTGKAFCEECGERICANGSKRSNGGKGKEGKLNYYYQCVGKVKHKNGCKNPALNKDWVEPKILKAVMNVVMDEEMLNQISQTAYEEILATRDAPSISTAQLKKELAQIDVKQERLTELYMEGEMKKEMLNEKNGELVRRRYQIEEELEKRKNIFEADDITADDIKKFIVEFVEDAKESYNEDDEFMKIMISTFVEKVYVNREQVTIHIRVPFSYMDRGYSGNLGGVICKLSTVNLVRILPRKTRKV